MTTICRSEEDDMHRNPYSVHPKLAKYAAGWDHYAAIAGNEDAELWQAYCAYLAEHDEWDGEPQRFDDWLACQQRYAAAWDESTAQLTIAEQALRDECAHDPDLALRKAYADYCEVTDEPLTYGQWIVALARVAGHLDAPRSITTYRTCSMPRLHLRCLR
jgi:hypothetical protein